MPMRGRETGRRRMMGRRRCPEHVTVNMIADMIANMTMTMTMTMTVTATRIIRAWPHKHQTIS